MITKSLNFHIKKLSKNINYLCTNIKDKPKKTTHKAEIETFLTSNQEFVNIKPHLPVNLLRRNRTTPEALYLIDKTVAKSIAFQIKDRVNLKNVTLLEINPGLGILSEELAHLGVKQLELLESRASFYEYLSEKFQNKQFHLQHVDFLRCWSLLFQDKFDNGGRFASVMNNITAKPWSSGYYFYIINYNTSGVVISDNHVC